MAMTQKNYKALAEIIRRVPIPQRVPLFNDLCVYLKEDNSRFKVWNFYEACFYADEMGELKYHDSGMNGMPKDQTVTWDIEKIAERI